MDLNVNLFDDVGGQEHNRLVPKLAPLHQVLDLFLHFPIGDQIYVTQAIKFCVFELSTFVFRGLEALDYQHLQAGAEVL